MHAPTPVRQSPRAATLVRGVLMIVLAAGCQTRRPLAEVPSTVPVDIGYATVDPRDVTGVISSASGEELSDRRTGRVEEMLEGRFAGLDVVRLAGGEFRLRIRGGRGEPLIVIDGIPSPLGLPNPLQDLTPAQIVAVSILKDAGSTAAFGLRGSNGVILITTRRP